MTGFEPRISGVGSNSSTNCLSWVFCLEQEFGRTKVNLSSGKTEINSSTWILSPEAKRVFTSIGFVYKFL